MAIDLDELERLHVEAAGTPYKAKGDWIYAQSVSHKRTFSRRPMAYTIDNRDGRYKPTETAAYIVAACNAMPELIKMYREAEDKANKAWRILLEAQGRIVEVQERVRELEGRNAELVSENSHKNRVIQLLECRMLEFERNPLPTCDALVHPRNSLQSNRCNAKEEL